MRGWKRFGIFALVGLLLSWIVSCSSPRPTSQAAGGTQTVEFWTMQLKAGYEDYFNQLIAEFESQNPGIQVKWVGVTYQPSAFFVTRARLITNPSGTGRC